MTIREQSQEIEKNVLSPYATLSAETKGRAKPEDECPIRTPFQRDRDRILHCKAFRRLKQKTQVFISPEGDHYRTRLTHTLEVSQIARTIARALRLNEDLTEAIAMGHDLGHTPFGHAGEYVLEELNPNGFKHNEQSLRVVDVLERNMQGLNLTQEVREGIVKHTGKEKPATLEGQIVHYADRIAYINHDIEDAITANILKEEDLPKEITDILGHSKSERITTLIKSIIDNSESAISMAPEIEEEYLKLRAFLFDNVYIGSTAKSEEHKVEKLLTELYEYYSTNVEELPNFYGTIAKKEGIDRAVTDYISGMSDEYAIHMFEKLFVPEKWNIM